MQSTVILASVFAISVTAATPVWLTATIVMLVAASSLAWYAIVSVFMSSALVVRTPGKVRHWIERAAGLYFVAVCGRILPGRNPLSP